MALSALHFRLRAFGQVRAASSVTIGRNFAAGLAGSFWPALISLAVVPLYLKYLGIESYGLIGFFLAMQAVMQLLDLGLSATISREVARCRAAGDIGACRNILRTFALVYWGVAVAISLIVMVAAPLISAYWLNSEAISGDVITRAVVLMGVAIATRWPSGLYLGALTGAERLVLANGVTIILSTIASIGAVAVLAFISPTIEAFFVWQALAGLALALAMRAAAWRAIGGSDGAQVEFATLQDFWRFSIAVSGVTVSGTLFTQLDKIILSKALPLADFGKYMLATTVAGLLYRLISPVFNVIFPRFSALVASGRLDELQSFYRHGTNAFAGLLFPVAMAMIIAAEAAVTVWTRNPDLAHEIAPIIAILTAGNCLHGMMYFPYALQLAHGNARLPLQINLVLSIVIVPLIITLSATYGAVGGALAWLTLHISYLLFGSWVTHRRLMAGVGTPWLLRDVGIPMLVSAAIGTASWVLVSTLQPAPLITLVIGSIACAGAIGVSFKASSRRLSDLKTLLGAPTVSPVLVKAI
jgi:O-antigen/teichoic acid export membrane protein